MKGTIGTVERAFQLAPDSASLDEVRARLRREGYSQVDEHLSGGALRASLKKLLGREVPEAEAEEDVPEVSEAPDQADTPHQPDSRA